MYSESLIKHVRYAWFLPIILIVIGLITGYLNHPSDHNSLSGIYDYFDHIWNLSILLLPATGIYWGVVAQKTTAGKIAVVLNLLALIYVALYGSGGGILVFGYRSN
jgi:hypothetical protein